MLPYWFVYIAICIRIGASLGYVRSIVKGKAKPNPITWFIWSLTAFVAFFAQLHAHVGVEVFVTLAIAVGPLLICISGLLRCPSASHFTPFSIICGLLAIIGIILWQATSNPLLAIICSIIADAFGGLPTIHKSYLNPHSEYALPYLLSIGSMALTLATIHTWRFANYAFPAYILLINLVIFSTITWRTKTAMSESYRG